VPSTESTSPSPANPAPVSPVSPVLSRLGEWWARWRPWLWGAFGLALVLGIGLALQGLLREVRYASVIAAIEATPALDIAGALLATAVSYLALTGYDASSLRYAGAKVARRTVLLTSFVAYALSNTIGLGPLSGGAVRMRLYAAAGLEPPQIAQVIVFNAMAFGLGMLAFGALGLLWGAGDVAPLLRLPAWALRAAAAAVLFGLAGFVWLCSRRRLLRIGPRWRLRLPPAGLALRQLAISAVELAASAAALWFLLPDDQIALPTFVAFYAIAIAAGIVSHVPGGVGVFEAVMLLATGAGGSGVPSDAMLGALLLNRGIYYLLPLVIATALLIVYELRSGVAAPVGRIAVHLSPRLMAALTLVAGVWLMVSGVTPFTEDAREILAALNVPLPLIEASHFLGSVAGLGLLLLARGLLHQLDAAWWGSLGLSIIAALLALPKGIALNEAAFLTVVATLLVISRRQFDRRSSLFAQHLEPEWLLALGGVIAACVWVLFFAYQEVGYSHQLWWQFELDGQAPRSLRALMGVALIGLAYGLWQLLRPPAGEVARSTPEELDRAAAIVRTNPSADACYALVGDKHLLFSPSGKSFIMFGKQGRSWVSLFGPFGEAREWPDLVWQFIELATDHGGRAAFYQVRPAALPLYLDCGLHALKLGEHAHVPLPEFNLKGAKRANLRSGVNRGEREGLVFEVVPAEGVAPLLPALRQVSDAWLQQQRGREKRFSVGRFDDDYLMRLPLAVVRQGERVIAFANLLMTDAKDEAALDLMRYAPDAPPGTMDFLFAKIMLHLQAQGFERFGLGMSPMAGMAERRRAPRWQRLGRLLFVYGDRFYNFRGLHSFKDKFEPVWEARYLAAPRGLAPVFVLADVAALIGGVKGQGGRSAAPGRN
jgi:phosphatidylglycerol lysyltransferase